MGEQGIQQADRQAHERAAPCQVADAQGDGALSLSGDANPALQCEAEMTPLHPERGQVSALPTLFSQPSIGLAKPQTGIESVAEACPPPVDSCSKDPQPQGMRPTPVDIPLAQWSVDDVRAWAQSRQIPSDVIEVLCTHAIIGTVLP